MSFLKIMALVLLSSMLTVPVRAQAPPQCTVEYLEEQKSELAGLEGYLKLSAEKIWLLCKVVNTTETTVGSILGPLGGNWTLNKLREIAGFDINLDVASRVCKWGKRELEKKMSPEEDRARLKAEIKRCSVVLGRE